MRKLQTPEENLLKKLDLKNKTLYKTYGISLSTFNRMLEDQKGVCYICQTLPKSKILCVDHIHILGYKKMPPEQRCKYVRGLLCYMCNTGLKGFEKTADGGRNRRSLDGTYRYFQQFKLKGEL